MSNCPGDPIELRRGAQSASESVSVNLRDGRRVIVHYADGETPPHLHDSQGLSLLTVGNVLYQFRPNGDAIESVLQGQLFELFDRGGTFVAVHEIGAAEFVKGEASPTWTLNTDILSDWKMEGDELVLKQWEDGAVVRKALAEVAVPVEVDLSETEMH